MSTYILDSTDKTFSVTLAPYTTNGTISPNEIVTPQSGTHADTSLLLFGQGMPNYGERIQENLIHLLENFASSVEPVHAIPGQLWFNKQSAQLRVCVADNVGSPAEWVPGDPIAWHVILQENAPLTQNFNAGGFTIFNLPDPTDDSHAASKKYVDDQIDAVISGQVSMDSLSDVEISTPGTGDVLVYGPIGGSPGFGWSNTNLSATYLSLSGGIMSGNITMGGNSIVGLPDPTPLASSAAATKGYVLGEISSIAIPAELNDLTDVDIVSPSVGEVMTYIGGGTWANQPPASNPLVMLTTGSTMTGFLTLSANPTNSFHAATKQYVDNAVSSGTDVYVNNVNFDINTYDLSITRTDLAVLTTSLEDLAVTTNINHPADTSNANTTLDEDLGTGTSYPFVKLDAAIHSISNRLGRFIPPVERVVFQANGTGTVVNLAEAAMIGQCNPTIPAGRSFKPYVVGSNRLSVYVNGSKQVASEFGYLTQVASSGILNHGTPTGLVDEPVGSPPALVTYSFRVNVNTQGYVQLDLSGPDVSTIGSVVAAINAITETQYFGPERSSPGTGDPQYAFGADVYDGAVVLRSALPGAGSPFVSSSITILDGPISGPNQFLWSSMVDVNSGSPAIDLISTGVSNIYPPQSYNYHEIGRPGQESYWFEFTTAPSGGAIIEVIIEPDVFGDELP